jgi:hypothetical protein
MRGTRIGREIEIYVANLANKTKCMTTNAQKNLKNCEDFFCENNCEDM